MYIYTYIRISTYCLKKKKNVLLNKNVISVFHTIFKLDFMKQFIFCIIQRVCIFSFTLFKLDIVRILTLPYSYEWQKFNKMIGKET